MTEPLICDVCAGAMVYGGRISLPLQLIYGCASCGKQTLVAVAPPLYQPRATQPDNHQQPQAQQQQQPQPKTESQHASDENDDARRLQSGLRGGGGDK